MPEYGDQGRRRSGRILARFVMEDIQLDVRQESGLGFSSRESRRRKAQLRRNRKRCVPLTIVKCPARQRPSWTTANGATWGLPRSGDAKTGAGLFMTTFCLIHLPNARKMDRIQCDPTRSLPRWRLDVSRSSFSPVFCFPARTERGAVGAAQPASAQSSTLHTTPVNDVSTLSEEFTGLARVMVEVELKHRWSWAGLLTSVGG